MAMAQRAYALVSKSDEPAAYEKALSLLYRLQAAGKEGTGAILNISLVTTISKPTSSGTLYLDNDGPLVGYMELEVGYVLTATEEELSARIQAAGIIIAEAYNGKHPVTAMGTMEERLGEAGKKAVKGLIIDHSGLNPNFLSETKRE
ncbi:MAG: hypothetical protein WC565_01635 [Parcubacteria group bacterium]